MFEKIGHLDELAFAIEIWYGYGVSVKIYLCLLKEELPYDGLFIL